MAWWDNPFISRINDPPLRRSFGGFNPVGGIDDPVLGRTGFPRPAVPVDPRVITRRPQPRPFAPVDPRVMVRNPGVGRITDPILNRSPQVVGRIDNPFLNYLRRR